MNPQKRLILEGERHKKEKSELLDAIAAATNLEAKIDVLLLIAGSTIKEQVATIDGRLAKLQKEWVQAFEAESAEVNQKLGGAMMLAQKLAGKEPLAITERIGAIVEKLKAGIESQEDRNDAFYEMMGHINALKKQ